MQVGSLVKAITNFDDVRAEWGFNYPHLGDVLTIKHIEPYNFGAMRGSKYVMLYFDELCLPFGICSMCFVEVQPPMDLSAVLQDNILQVER